MKGKGSFLKWEKSKMSHSKEDALPELVDTKAAAKILQHSPATLKRWRYLRTGPSYIVIGGKIYYDIEELRRFLRRNTRTVSAWANAETSSR
jgi:predicted DCC family thiol-disulfide oxidoreductase YuxK